MKDKLNFLVPTKKTVVVFVLLSLIMGLATLQGEGFSENESSALYRILFWVTVPAWEIWLYFSAPILYLFGLIPQSNVRWMNFESWETVYTLNLLWNYLVASIVNYFWNMIGKYVKMIEK